MAPFAFINVLAGWLDDAVAGINSLFPADFLLANDFVVRSMLAVLIVTFLCGALGSIVVGSRMAFFSDALAHCAFAGVAIGLLVGLALGAGDESFRRWITTIMVLFGLGIGILIAYVREKTGLSSDTVIGVFFAIAVGLGGIFERAARGKTYFNLEQFIFGNPVTVTSEEIVWLLLLLPPTLLFLWFLYNPLVFGTFNTSLARSRQMPVRLANYAFIGLLAVIINLCVQIVGVLLITGMLIVPAATSSLMSRNLRQFFWYSVLISVLSGVFGIVLNWEIQIYDPANPQMPIRFGVSGTIVVLGGLAFVLALVASARARR
ncbi:MAG: metal ABC transporter permease [Gemmataceae bacterium]